MSRITVEYKGGQGRHGQGAVDYMLVEVDCIELYVEATPIEGDETATYDGLRAAIVEQAKRHGIDPARLRFQYD